MSMSSPLNSLHASRRALDAAEQNCAHWDYEDARLYETHDCCDALRIARRTHKHNLIVWRRRNQEPKP